MSTIPLWGGGDDQSWQVVFVAGIGLPGVPMVSVTWDTELDIKKPSGKSGATMTSEGDNPATVTILMTLATRDDLDLLPEALAALKPQSDGAAKQPLDIIYPSVNALGVESIVVKSIVMPPPTAGAGWPITINARQWVPKPKTQKKLKPKKRIKPNFILDFLEDPPSLSNILINTIPDFFGF